MALILNKTQFTIIAIVVILAIPVIGRLNYFINSTAATGVVTEIVIYHGYNGNYNTGAKIDFYTKNGTLVKIEAIDIIFKSGIKVPVLYKNNNPENAVVYSFASIWVEPLIWWCLVPLLFLAAFNLAYMQKKSKLIITLPLTKHSVELINSYRNKKNVIKKELNE